ncbi:MAG: BRO family protein, partial [Gammaproteobacteria bacterium]|nr:BRO family protein [Gammaproteobacteria bacterium]
IRVIDMVGEPWFPAKDVCDALGIKNPSSAVLKSCSKHQHCNITKSSLANHEVSFPNRGMLCVSKSGLYKLLFVSRKPAALVFQDWVTDVVLPSIMKNGGYIMGQEKVVTGEMTRAELAKAG